MGGGKGQLVWKQRKGGKVVGDGEAWLAGW